MKDFFVWIVTPAIVGVIIGVTFGVVMNFIFGA